MGEAVQVAKQQTLSPAPSRQEFASGGKIATLDSARLGFFLLLTSGLAGSISK